MRSHSCSQCSWDTFRSSSAWPLSSSRCTRCGKPTHLSSFDHISNRLLHSFRGTGIPRLANDGVLLGGKKTLSTIADHTLWWAILLYRRRASSAVCISCDSEAHTCSAKCCCSVGDLQRERGRQSVRKMDTRKKFSPYSPYFHPRTGDMQENIWLRGISH